MRGILWMLVVVAWSGCGDRGNPAGKEGAVHHVVVCWLKRPGNAEDRQRLMAAAEGFRGLPGLQSLTGGAVLPSARPLVESGYDVLLIMTFKNEEALRAYEAHPLHQQAVRDVLQPLTQKVIVYDAVSPGP
jgi:hypothetical protein